MTDDDPKIDAEVALQRMRRHSPNDFLAHRLGNQDVSRLVRAIEGGVPAASLAVMARWWQFETYLRLLLYVELRGILGSDWQTPLTGITTSRAQHAAGLRYMASADDAHLLAHLDVGRLFELIDQYWAECSLGIGLPKTVWAGRVEEVRPIRHRLAHCRRPHADDASRLEQLLRDLEPAANRVLRAYTDWCAVRHDLSDPVVDAWVHLQHPDALRLVNHGHNTKGIHFELMASHLPGAEVIGTITGSPGWFWVMHVVLEGRRLYVDDFWSSQTVKNLMPLAAHIVQSSSWTLAVTIPAAQDADVIADAIGGFLNAVFEEVRPGEGTDVRHPWRRPEPDLDPRVDAEGLLSVLSGLNPEDPISIFDAA